MSIENQTPSRLEMPFEHEKIPVSNGLDDLKEFIAAYPGFSFCPYLADKDAQQWDASTSRVYMNQVLSGFLYVPVNIPKNDQDQLSDVLEFAASQHNFPAVNITQPHKSSPVLRRMFLGNENSEENVDTLIRDSEGQLLPYDLNAPAFVSWFNDEVGSFEDRSVILIGVGGVGEPMAKHIADQRPRDLILIDPVNKENLAGTLNDRTATRYHSSIAELRRPEEGVVVINAAGKEGALDSSKLAQFLEENAKSRGVFVDIRPHLEIDIVKRAEDLGWDAYTGHGMNARNDFILLQGIAANLGVEVPSFDAFEQLVTDAS